jgi:hypothetical protein
MGGGETDEGLPMAQPLCTLIDGKVWSDAGYTTDFLMVEPP